MKTRPLWLLAFLVVGFAHWAEAQQSTKIPRIGYLLPLDAGRESNRAEIIRQSMRELGYIEGQNIVFEYRYAEGKQDRYTELAAELARLKVDTIW